MTYTTDATTGVITASSLINNLVGRNYIDGQTYRVTIPGGFTALVNISADSISTARGAQFAFDPSFRGLGYQTGSPVTIRNATGIAFSGPQVFISGGVTTGAVATATANLGPVGSINQDKVVDVTVQFIGSGYTVAPNITFESPGIVSVTPVTSGTGYGAGAPSVLINGGSGSQANVSAVIGTAGGPQAGQVVSYTVNNPGFGYVSTASATIAQPGLVSISPVNTGSGYSLTAPQVSIAGGGGGGATATAVVGTGSEAGKIVSYAITAPGSGFTSTGVGNVSLLGPITNTGLVTTVNYTSFAGTNSGYTTTGAAVPVTIIATGLVTQQQVPLYPLRLLGRELVQLPLVPLILAGVVF